MKNILNIHAPVIALVVLLAAPALAQNIDKGRKAYFEGDYPTAMRELKGYSGDSEVLASYLIGQMYRLGNGVSIDFDEAAYWYRKSAEKGHIVSPYHLGSFYAKGDGVPQNLNKAIEWWCVSGRHGFAPAQELLVSSFFDHEEAKSTCPSIKEWETEALGRDQSIKNANEGDPEAQFQLAEMYRTGKGGITQNITTDYAKAEAWYLKAAAQGHPEAHYRLGLMHYHGDRMGGHLPVDYREAFSWFSGGATRGHVGSQKYMGFMLSEGKGAIKDKLLSLMWYEIASTNMDSGEKAVTNMSSRRIKADLSDSQIAAAKEKARICMSSNYQKCN